MENLSSPVTKVSTESIELENPETPTVKVIIPAFNEMASVGEVIGNIPKDLVDEIIVVDNGSTDRTPEIASGAGATVIKEPERGYGNACLAGIRYLGENGPPDIVVFIDADHSDDPREMQSLLDPILGNNMDLVIGARISAKRESGSMTPQQLFGNWLASRLMRYLTKTRFTDLGPFRAIRFGKLLLLEMKDRNYGWTVEMQIKAQKRKLNYCEVPVSYRRRINGRSKVSGSVTGSIKAGTKILWTLAKYM